MQSQTYESGRLQALYRYDILDTLPERVFDDLTLLASQIFNVPMALISFIDVDRQWFKSKIGQFAEQTDRCVAFCSHAIEQDEVFVVADPLGDPRFKDNPYVLSDPNIRFYAGAPLFTPDGFKIGTLCVIDNKLRSPTANQLKALQTLAAQVISILELDLRNREKGEVERNQILLREKAAQESSELKSRFLANMSHEIRTPISGVIGMIDLILDTSLTQDQKSYADSARRCAQSLLCVINDILDLSKIEAGKLDFEKIDFSLSQLIQDIEGSLSRFAEQKGLKFTTNIKSEIPEHLQGDPGRIRQILNNLIANAIKFTHRGQIELHLNVTTQEKDEVRLSFEIHDTGIGISEQTLSQLFKPFTQADASTSRKYGGTGLGLSISKNLVEQMKGQIGARSIEGKGSVFWFTLDLCKGTASQVDLTVTSQKATVLTNKKVARILLAEDNPVNQIIAKRMLEKIGHQVVVVGNGQEAIQAIQNQTFDLILLDCQMPEMDGYEATALIRKSACSANRNIPILAMTANAMKGDEEKCLAIGMNDYISKPISPQRLTEILNKWL